jgi:hypothetical protein
MVSTLEKAGGTLMRQINAYYVVDLQYDERLERDIQMMDSPCYECRKADCCPDFGSNECDEREERT